VADKKRGSVMKLGLITVAGITVSLTVAGAWAVADEGERSASRHQHGWHQKVEKVVLHDANGDRVGKVWLRKRGDYVRVWASLHSLPPGFHGFHVHSSGICDPADPAGPFMSAGSHYNPDESDHSEHAGDLPSLYVTDNGWARLGFMTDAFTLAELRDSDGSAVMVHGGRDNFANIPEDRYGSLQGDEVPDETTLGTGDAGSRYACGVVD
jgi:Cu-Zn family superoxide dismutase